MDRLIKFRGQGLEYVEWIFGGIAHDREAIINEDYLAIPVDRNTVGEFTGFKDIKNHEIFEDDFVQNTEYPEDVYLVERRRGGWYVNDDGEYVDLCWVLEHAPFKVIGNIHDNPELLKEGMMKND